MIKKLWQNIRRKFKKPKNKPYPLPNLKFPKLAATVTKKINNPPMMARVNLCHLAQTKRKKNNKNLRQQGRCWTKKVPVAPQAHPPVAPHKNSQNIMTKKRRLWKKPRINYLTKKLVLRDQNKNFVLISCQKLEI